MTHLTRSRAITAILMIGVLITAVNLRISIIAVSPLLDDIRDDLGLSSTVAGLLTTLPVLCFGLFAPIAPRLAYRFGLDHALAGAMIVLTVAIALRSLPSTAVLFLATALIGMAIGVGNVLLPATIKRDFPLQTGLMTGLLTMAISASGTIGAGLTVPLQDATGFDWRGTLALWAIPVVVAVVALAPRLRFHAESSAQRTARPRVRIDLWRDPVAWSVTGIMGLQSFSFYALAAWFPTMMIDNGMSHDRAGLLLSLTNFAGFFSAFLVPVFASRRRSQEPYVIATIGLWFIALLGLLVAPMSAPVLWVIIWGLAAGSALSLSLSFFTLRAPNTQHAAQLSGMAQTVGYIVAATGPFIVGFLHDRTGGWNTSIVFLMGVLGVMLFFGIHAARDRQVGNPLAE
jgi:CP family cyanate transporter-like MFS transporter